MHTKSRRHALVLAAAMIAAVAVPALPAAATSQTFTVTKAADTADGTCDGDCSLREAVTAANANPGHDTVVLPADNYLLTLADSDEDLNANGDLDISDDITLVGDGAATTTIDAGGDLDGAADGDFRIIEVTTDAALGVVGVTLTGGDAGDGDGVDGGAILLAESAVLSLNGVIVEDNFAASDGGAIDAREEGQIIRIEDSVLRRNEAGSSGGALGLEEGAVTLRNSRFASNTAGFDGGALHLYTETNAEVWDTQFVDNTAGSDGGAILIGDSGHGSQLTCHTCTISGNHAGGDGGGLYMGSYENLAEFWDATIAENTSESEGGGIWFDESALIMEDSVVRDNVAYDDAGGVGGEEIFLVMRNVDVLDNAAVNPTDPTAETTGGGISNEEDYGDMVLENVRVEGNFATHAGAGLYLYETSVVIRDSEFVDNTVVGGGAFDVEGGAISETNESRIVIERSHFEGNSVTGQQNAHGGAIWREEGPTTIVDSSFVDNTAHTTYTTDTTYVAAGGALFTDYSTPTPFEVRRSLFAGNAATADTGGTGYGGAIFLEDNNTAVVTNSTFSANDATTAGGVFYGMDSGQLRLTSSTMVANTSGNGGGIFLAPDTGSGAGQASLTGVLAQDHGNDTCAGDPVVSNGWNIVDDATCGLDEASDQDGTAAAYEPLADNGGPTMTHALPASSAAVDAGAAVCMDVAGAFAVTTDQRGAGRPVDGDVDGDVACDVGAFEYQEAVTVVASDPDADEDPGDEDDGLGEFTFSRPGTSGDLQVRYTVGGSATAGDDYTALSGTVTIPDGQASATVTVAPVADDSIEGPETAKVTIVDDVDYVVGSPSSAVVTIADTVEVAGSGRLAGLDRTETAIAVSNASYARDQAGAVVLTRADLYPDALAGTPLAAAVNAPILLTPPSQLLDNVEDEIARVLPDGGKVYLLGGTNALAPAVQDRLDSLGYDTERVAGPDRIQTSIAIANELGNPDTLLVTTGFDFPDALSAGAAAAKVGGAVVLTTPESPHASTSAYLDDHPGATAYAIGGPAARAYPGAVEVFGADRVRTSLAVAERFFSSPPAVGIAVMHNFPDALTGGAHVAGNGGPLLLTSSAGVLEPVRDYLCANAASLESVYVYGGTGVLSTDVFEQSYHFAGGGGC